MKYRGSVPQRKKFVACLREKIGVGKASFRVDL